MLTKLTVRPRNSMVWFGTSTGFSLLITKPRHSNRCTKASTWSRAIPLDSAKIKMSLMQPLDRCPFLKEGLRLASQSW